MKHQKSHSTQITTQIAAAAILVLSAAAFSGSAAADDLSYGELGLGGFCSFTQTREPAAGSSEDSVEGGLTLFGDAMMYEANKAFVMLWEIESAVRVLGGYGFGEPEGGFGGMEFRGNGDIGISVAGILPINQAVEDTKLRFTSNGFEGKTLIGTTHVLPIGNWTDWDNSHRILYFSVSHGFRFYSELEGWTWAVQPKVRLVDLEHARVQARYLFGLWHQNRREHSGTLSVDIPVGEKLFVSAFGEAEYLQKARNEGTQVGWTGMLEVTGHFLND